VLDQFQLVTGWHNDPSLVSDQLYIVEPGLCTVYHNSSFNGTLIFSLGNGPVVEIPTKELAGPVRGIDPSGKRVLQPNITNINIFDKSAPEGTAVLGKVFLSRVCFRLLIISPYEILCLLNFSDVSDCQL
jgi:hypothetical protein